MSAPFRISLLGFSASERSTLVSHFRMATHRQPRYEAVEDTADADCVVVDADDADAVRQVVVAGRAANAVFVGALAPSGASAWVMRPIDPQDVLRELDAMVKHPASGPAPSHPPSQGWMPLPDFADLDIPFPTAATPPAPAPAPKDPHKPRRRAAPAQRGCSCLVVDGSPFALHDLETRLQAQGMQTETAMNSGQAIKLLTQKAYDFVFLDVDLGEDSELNGLSLCQHIKRQHRHVGGHREPVVVLVSAHHSQMDRVRGTLAGAEAYLGKPLDETALARLLQQHGITLLHPPAVLASPKAREPEAR